jgi:hypothetical protein
MGVDMDLSFLIVGAGFRHGVEDIRRSDGIPEVDAAAILLAYTLVTMLADTEVGAVLAGGGLHALPLLR